MSGACFNGWTHRAEKNAWEKLKDPLRKHKIRAGLVVILVVNMVKNIRQEKKWKPVENKADGSTVWYSDFPSFPRKNKKIKNKSDPVQHWIAPVMQQA